MKKKIKIFLSERKDLLLFIGVLLVILATILTVANLSDSSENEFVLIPSDDSEVVNPQIEEKEKLTLPIEEEYIIVKEFFDLNEPSTLENAIFNLGNQND